LLGADLAPLRANDCGGGCSSEDDNDDALRMETREKVMTPAKMCDVMTPAKTCNRNDR